MLGSGSCDGNNDHAYLGIAASRAHAMLYTSECSGRSSTIMAFQLFGMSMGTSRTGREERTRMNIEIDTQ